MDTINLYCEEDFPEIEGGDKIILAMVSDLAQALVNITENGCFFFRYTMMFLQYLKFH